VILLAYAIALVVPAFAFYLIHALDLFKTSKPQTVAICALWGALGPILPQRWSTAGCGRCWETRRSWGWPRRWWKKS
jgi:hypothetical protein